MRKCATFSAPIFHSDFFNFFVPPVRSSLMSELLQSLNSRQLQAVTAPEESILILAGAGSGKTRVLTTRIAWLLSEHRASTAEILAVTFTNKAAKEMLVRLETMLPYDLRHMWVGTFHGLCNRILRRHAEDAGLPKTFQILDSGDQLSLVKRVMKALDIDTDSCDPRQVQNFINWNKENGIRASRSASHGSDERGVRIYQAYESQCQKEGVVDFAELLLRCYELLDRNEIVRLHYQNRFRHILVDEFQDTNVLQYRWLQMLAGFGRGPEGRPMNAVFAVGDDDQSIYAFRGANVGNMSDFLKDFGVPEPIRLEENYRSTGTILDAANAIISNNSNRLGKNLWTSGSRGTPITVVRHEDDRAEARWIAEEIQADHMRGRPWRDHAVLYRMNAQSRALEGALTAAGIPYRVYGGQRFFERAEVKHVLAYLRLLDNPGDDTSFLRVVNFPARGIGARTIESLAGEAVVRNMSLWRTLEAPGWKVPAKLSAFRDMILRMRVEAEGLSLTDTVRLVIARSGLEAFYRTEKDGEDRIANMNEMLSAAAGYLANEGLPADFNAFALPDEADQTPIQGYLAQATLEAGDKNEQGDVDAVQLMTVHAAKGLEFREVFIAGCEEGIFPHFSAVNDVHGPGVDEERRLMYVAVTRAKERLVITNCVSRMQYGENRRNKPSSFIEEIPESLRQERNLAARRGWDDEDSYDERSSYGWERPSFGGSRSGSSRGRSSYGGYGGKSYGSSSYGSSRSSGNASQSGSADRDDWRRGLAGKGTYSAKEDPLVKRAAEKRAGDTFGFGPGDRLRHGKFGEGTVESISGSGAGARIRIRFDNAGLKELMLALAVRNMEKC